jgi:AraC family transcriptional regulator
LSLIAELIWYIERHLDQPLSLSRVAKAHGVSACHVTRLFAMTCDVPLMTYVRQRRLSKAARAISAGCDIIDIALDAGYASHEAFGRAIRKQFGKTPRELRHISLIELNLTEPLSMTTPRLNPAPTLPFQAPRIETRAPLTIAGLSASYAFSNLSGIPAQWQALRPHLGHIDGALAGVAYGVSYRYRPDGIDYLAGVAIEGSSDLPPGFATVVLSAGRHAVFEHRGHVSGIGHTWSAIYDAWLSHACLTVRRGPAFERMDKRFDANSGTGLIEIWVPIQ